MKFFVAAVLAMATAAFAAPTVELEPRTSGSCSGNVVCTDKNLLAVDVDLGLDVGLGGLLDIGVDLDLGLLLGHHRKCKAVYCCPAPCQAVGLLFTAHFEMNQNSRQADCRTGRAYSRLLLQILSIFGLSGHRTLLHATGSVPIKRLTWGRKTMGVSVEEIEIVR